MVISQGNICWADLGEPAGSDPGDRRPVVVLQGNAFNRSRLATAICAPLTSNVALARAPGNILLRARETGLPKDSVANMSQLVTIDKVDFESRVGALSRAKLLLLFAGLDVVLGAESRAWTRARR
ncbi:MAG: type II toxin-antitoxin system PemK/MazF family toxin [Clostridia bacterium]|nr:type II toxin-antitoxin system PemK/MazF family toxin [Deltaproteobacteria bacterium]